MNVDRNGRAAFASFTMKICCFNELAISHTETQNLGLQHQDRDAFSKSRTICESVTTAIMTAGGVGSRVRIDVKSVAINWEGTFCSAASACFSFARSASAIAYNQIDASMDVFSRKQEISMRNELEV